MGASSRQISQLLSTETKPYKRQKENKQFNKITVETRMRLDSECKSFSAV